MWSVGATLVAALTQGSGLPGEAPQGDPKLPATIPEPFRGIARECLHLDPKRRSSIAELMARLEPAGRSVPEPEPMPTPRRRSSRGMATIAIVAIALLVGLIAFLSRGKNAQPQSSSGSAEQTNQPQSSQPPTPQAPPAVSLKPAPASAASSSSTRASATPTSRAKTPHTPTANPSAPQGDVVHRVIPDVSQSARNTITGKIKVTARVEVDSSGKVSAAKLTSPGPSKYFARLALNAAQGWEFSPPQVDGQPAASAWVIRFRFGRKGTEASAERASH
jgi:TonB family protein